MSEEAVSQPAWINVFGDVETEVKYKVDLIGRREASTERCFHDANPEVSMGRMARGDVEGSRGITGRVESVVLGIASSIRSTICSESSSAESTPVSIDIARRKAIESAIKYSYRHRSANKRSTKWIRTYLVFRP